ncbi:DUF4810 domain-containing protein [Coralloluteibacterium thermophilus]|uniref:DUF4810 domain-containing protein n=1 Tax=Coralloluteibacterium thermophilum TaxID=2707049 RepID=A0ABV9NK58_9GAMM
MKNDNTRARRWLVACGLALLATACAHTPPSLYHWGSYQSQVYGYLKGESPEKQIQELERDLQTMLAADRPAPPGLHAHLGMLYAESGNDAKALESLLAEKAQYPESATYIDFLLKKYQQ